MMTITIAKKDWGGCDICIDFKKIDFLPRFTLSELTGCMFLNIGFLMITFTLCVYDDNMRRFVKKLESGEIETEMDKAIKTLKTLKDDTVGKGDKKDSQSSSGD